MDFRHPVPHIRVPFTRRLMSWVTSPQRAVFGWIARRFMRANAYPFLFWCFMSHQIEASLHTALKLNIFELLKDGPLTAGQLAEACGAHQQTLYRMLRALAAIGVLDRRPERCFALNQTSRILLDEHPMSLRPWGLLCGDMVVPAMTHFHESVLTGESLTKLAYGKSCWEALDERPESLTNFDRAMSLWSESHVARVAEAYDYSQFRTLVDVGGGRGALLAAILQTSPQTEGILYDRPPVVPAAEERFARLGLSDRARTVGGSFLDEVPAGADGYIIKHALHDWNRENALRILQNIRAVMTDDSRLLIVEGLVDHNIVAGEPFRAWWDLTQMTTTFGQSRTLEEFQDLLDEAGFQLRTIVPTKTIDALILECHPVALPSIPADASPDSSIRRSVVGA